MSKRKTRNGPRFPKEATLPAGLRRERFELDGTAYLVPQALETLEGLNALCKLYAEAEGRTGAGHVVAFLNDAMASKARGIMRTAVVSKDAGTIKEAQKRVSSFLPATIKVVTERQRLQQELEAKVARLSTEQIKKLLDS